MVGIKSHRIETHPAVPPPQPAPGERAELLKDVVDFLFPRIPPTEAALYLYLLRHSMFETGEPYARLSNRDMTKGAIGSPHRRPRKGSLSNTVSSRSVQKALPVLEKLGAIRKEGAPNRQGTLYRVLLPDEIAACRAAKRAARVPPALVIDVKTEADFYNVRANRLKIFERDEYKCRYCTKQLTRHTATLDHVVPVRAGGGNGWDNLVTACFDCNASKTGRALGDFLAERAL